MVYNKIGRRLGCT